MTFPNDIKGKGACCAFSFCVFNGYSWLINLKSVL